METLGDKIKQLRNQLTQEELSAILQVDRSTLASWEVNRREPDIATLRRIAAHFNVSIDWLAGHAPERQGENAASRFQESADLYRGKADETWHKVIEVAKQHGITPDIVGQLLECHIKLAQSLSEKQKE